MYPTGNCENSRDNFLIIFRAAKRKSCVGVKSSSVVVPSCLYYVLLGYIRGQLDQVLRWAVVYLVVLMDWQQKPDVHARAHVHIDLC